MVDVSLVLAVGIAAGILTTVAGFGGGLMITLALSLAFGPHAALATAAAALFIGNAHRLISLRHDIDRSATLPMAIGALIGAVIGGLVTSALTASTIRWLLVGVSALAVARALDWIALPRHRAVLAPGGFGVGFAAATTGGGGLLLAPLMLAVGLTDVAFLATGTAVALTVHIGRIGAYASAHVLTVEQLPLAAVLAVGLVLGNAAGFRIRNRLTASTRRRSTWIVLGVGLVLALVGVAGPH